MCYSCATYKLTYLGSHTRKLLLYKINVNVCCAARLLYGFIVLVFIYIYTSSIYRILYNIFKRGLAAAQTLSDLILHIHINMVCIFIVYIEKEKITFIFFYCHPHDIIVYVVTSH